MSTRVAELKSGVAVVIEGEVLKERSLTGLRREFADSPEEDSSPKLSEASPRGVRDAIWTWRGGASHADGFLNIS